MPVSPYFELYPNEFSSANEHNLLEDLVDESISMMGHNVYYIPRESFDPIDMVLGEDTNAKFTEAYMMAAYIASTGGFEGQNDIFTKFGLEIRDTGNFVVSRREFKRVVPTDTRDRPQEGDLLYLPVFHRMFEVKFVEEESEHFSLGKRNPYTYDLRCELFRYSQEPITTGVNEIDDVATDNAFTQKLYINQMSDAGISDGNYFSKEIVFQSTDDTYANTYAQATVKDWDRANGAIYVQNLVGEFRASANLIGETTQVVYNVYSVEGPSDNTVNDIYDNATVRADANVVLHQTETNPFGTP
jgi:hypothetical protein